MPTRPRCRSFRIAPMAPLALALAMAAASGATEPLAEVELGGRWELVPDLSQTFREALAAARPGRGSGFPLRPKTSGGAAARERRAAAARAYMAGLDRGSRELEITGSRAEVWLRGADDRLRIVFTDGRKDQRFGPQGEYTVRAEWSDSGELTVSTRLKELRTETTEVYRYDADDDRLRVDITADGPDAEITVQRTYRRANGE